MQIDTTIYCEEKIEFIVIEPNLEGIPWVPYVPKGNCSVRDRFKKNNVITKYCHFLKTYKILLYLYQDENFTGKNMLIYFIDIVRNGLNFFSWNQEAAKYIYFYNIDS